VTTTTAGTEHEHEREREAERDPDLERITSEEEKVLRRVQRAVEARRSERPTSGIDYDAELIALRDQINEARLEDVPPLIEEMERLQQVASRRAQVTEGVVDPASPYFGRLVLEENEKKREVLIGRSTFLDPTTGVRIVDWRDAPVSRVYYRYDEGDDYEETFGGRDVEGDVLVRRSLAIAGGELRRIGAPQGTFFRDSHGVWRRAADSAARLAGGQGAAMRPEGHHRPGKLGTGADDGREDKHLQEIAALIDPRQFQLITAPDSGLVVIQGGAGSGKTTIGLHRLAYLAFQDPKRFRADKMLVVVFNDALARYISRVLPALGVAGVLVITYERWAHRLRTSHVQGLPKEYDDDTPPAVVRLKKSPAMLRMVDEHVERLGRRVAERVESVLAAQPSPALRDVWTSTSKRPPAHRLRILHKHLARTGGDEGETPAVPLVVRHALERAIDELRGPARDVVAAWAEILTDEAALRDGLARHAPGAFDDEDVRDVLAWCNRRCTAVLARRDEELERTDPDGERGDEQERASSQRSTREQDDEHGEARGRDGGDEDDDDRSKGIDGVDELEAVALDREDDTILLRLVQKMRGSLGRKREVLSYEHVFIDEAQDLSPVELSVILDTVSEHQSVTMAGDLAQRLHMYNGFSDWRGVLHDLGLDHVKVEPLKLSYRSTKEIIEFSADVLGPLRNEEEGQATRHGAPVELFRFAHSGDAVGFLAEALRDLLRAEPRASIAVIARYSEQADMYYRGLKNAEVPNLRRIAEQDFPFKAGVDVTDVRQVKGLEFDYVVLVEVSTATYPEDDEARHLLHIAATRAAHQLWVTTTGEPSLLVPAALRERGY
jgi:DNA helicase-2/ATP-dependent DNA helicase PcrA